MTAPALLLGLDEVRLYDVTATDEHGWAYPAGAPAWSGTGNLQLEPGMSDPGGASGGGAGPYDPAAGLSGTLYLPPDARPVDGMAAVIGDDTFALSQVRKVADPLAGRDGGVACWVARVTGTAQWPPDVAVPRG